MISKELKIIGIKDEVFARDVYPKPFEFNRDVAVAFDDMAHRSIPLYAAVQELILEWTSRFAEPHSCVYDIGCSTGSTLAMLCPHLMESIQLVGIDSSEAMIDQAREKLKGLAPGRIELRCDDALKTHYDKAKVVILNYTLQFLPIVHRRTLLAKIFRGLLPGGLLIVSEKLRAICPEFEEVVTEVYEEFKSRNGYSSTEIARKKAALEQVLIPLTFADHTEMIKSAGFINCEIMIRWHNFTTFVAMKPYD